ncbi:nuclease-related domain-containing protein [Bacillus mycoides]|uniref:Nuclease n=1 Tax=Bacillus thuringiensis serovar navarrensis TaxID=339658 RepID=A0A243A9R5_BACTU|nr:MULTISPECIES: nuclease-related domain-containing protein [Bacillus cereus group]MBJ7995160.1 NERD domain-containing protein [Bacillus cereus]MED1266420.1 nuclease-related domain-containing protein [Bacillus mycoides]MED1402516.1 nuclease-related domain-containing protein [Bacillus mycoides]OTY15306.1 nuclease [Bacillus thuringiensis serovar navarrensis]QWH83051.1 NERD domain-containing protein [Bacillus mycoides]
MIVKERKMPMHLLQLEALLRRLPIHHPKRSMVAENLAKFMAGYKGEQAIEYPLSFLPEAEYSILHDIRLFDQKHYFQIDTIVVSSYFLLFLEIKNIIGTLIFDAKFNQLIRISDDASEEGFPDPLLQLKRQEMQLRKWLSLHGLHNLPIESLVVISSPRTIIKTSDKILLSKVIHSANLPNRIKQIKNQYKEKSLGNINGLIDQIMNEHSPQRQNILAQYKIKKVELLKGVQCEECFTMAMLKEKQGWRCSNCNSVSKHAHLRALQDYTLLFEMITTNRKLKDFLNMQSSSAVKRLLQTMNIPHTGENKGRIYDLTSFQ